MKKRTKILLSCLIGLLVLIGGGFGVLKAKTYSPTAAAQTAAQNAKSNAFGDVYQAQHPDGLSVIFYPGALVEPQSYSLWASALAKQGTTVYVAHFPLNLAVLNGDRAQKLLPKIKGRYVIGGHSLGGVMAARFAATHPSAKLAGVFFLASYADSNGSLVKSGLPVLSITASNDHVLNTNAYQKAKQNLPKSTQYIKIPGNHGGFGSYGHQGGDGKAPISNQDQQRLVCQTLRKWLQKVQASR